MVDEASQGDADVSGRRLTLLEELSLLETTESAEALATAIVSEGALSPRAFADALHIAVATVHEVDYLLTWNCAHIANAEILPRIGVTCSGLGFVLPFVCTPDELLGEERDD